MIDLEYEMTFAERIEGPPGPTTGSPARLCRKIAEATLAGPRITDTVKKHVGHVPGQARRDQPHRGRRPGAGAEPDPLIKPPPAALL